MSRFFHAVLTNQICALALSSNWRISAVLGTLHQYGHGV